LTLNDEVIAEGHSLSNMDWFTLLAKQDILFGGREISDEDMEAGDYLAKEKYERVYRSSNC